MRLCVVLALLSLASCALAAQVKTDKVSSAQTAAAGLKLVEKLEAAVADKHRQFVAIWQGELGAVAGIEPGKAWSKQVASQWVQKWTPTGDLYKKYSTAEKAEVLKEKLFKPVEDLKEFLSTCAPFSPESLAAWCKDDHANCARYHNYNNYLRAERGGPPMPEQAEKARPHPLKISTGGLSVPIAQATPETNREAVAAATLLQLEEHLRTKEPKGADGVSGSGTTQVKTPAHNDNGVTGSGTSTGGAAASTARDKPTRVHIPPSASASTATATAATGAADGVTGSGAVVKEEPKVQEARGFIKDCLSRVTKYPPTVLTFGLSGSASAASMTGSIGGSYVADLDTAQVGVVSEAGLGSQLSLVQVGISASSSLAWKSGNYRRISIFRAGKQYTFTFSGDFTVPGVEISLGGTVHVTSTKSNLLGMISDLTEGGCTGVLGFGAEAGIGLGASSPVNAGYSVTSELSSSIILDCHRVPVFVRWYCFSLFAMGGPGIMIALVTIPH